MIRRKLVDYLVQKVEHAIARSPAIRRLATQDRLALAMARAAATGGLRVVDPKAPLTWEFSGFSQNGEDGIVDHLCGCIARKNRFFVEIGSSDGLENSSSWLALGRRYTGIMVEGDPELSRRCREAFEGLNWGLDILNMYVDPGNIGSITAQVPYPDPDFFSLDIDSIDYYVAEAVLDSGLRPKVFAVEYNSNFGPERSVTIPYRPRFDRWEEHPSGMYYGVSIAAWRRFFLGRGYRFVTVDSNGVNAFFVDPAAFPDGFADGLEGLEYRENIVDRRPAEFGGRWARIGEDWRARFESIASLPLVEI